MHTLRLLNTYHAYSAVIFEPLMQSTSLYTYFGKDMSQRINLWPSNFTKIIVDIIETTTLF